MFDDLNNPFAVPEPVCFDPEANLGEVDTYMPPDGESYQPLTVEERRARCVRRCVEHFHYFRDCPQRKAAEDSWNLAYALVMAWKETTAPEEVILPEVWREVETMLPQMKGLGSAFEYVARQAGFDDMAAATTAIVRDQYMRYGSDEEVRAYKKDLVINGNAYLVPTWSRFKRIARKMESAHGPDAETVWKRETTEIMEDGPIMRHVQGWNIFTHPKVAKAEDSPCVCVVEGMSADAIKTQVRNDYLDAAAAEELLTDSGGQYRPPEGRVADDGDDELSGALALYEYMTVWMNGWEYVIVNETHLLRAVPLQDGKTPIISDRLYPMAGEHYSEGLPIKLASLQRAVNQMMTYKMGQAAFASNPVLMLQKGSTILTEWNAKKIRPGSTLACDKMDQAKYLEYPMQVIGTIDETIGALQNQQKACTGITDRLSGQGENNGTATLGVRLQQAATERIAYMVEGMQAAFRQIYVWFYNLNARHLERVYACRIYRGGQKLRAQYTPEVFMPDVDVEIDIGVAVGAEQVNMWGNIFKMLATVPGFDPIKLGDKMLKAAGETRIAEEFHTNAPNAQGDALADLSQLYTTGIVPDAKPGDNHQVHVQIKSMAMESPKFMALPPQWQQNLQGNVAAHQAFLAQMQQAAAAQSQQGMEMPGGGQGVGGGATPVQGEANNRANGMFDMGEMGRQQMMPAA